MFSLIGKVIVWMAVFHNVGVGHAAVGMDNKVRVGMIMTFHYGIPYCNARSNQHEYKCNQIAGAELLPHKHER